MELFGGRLEIQGPQWGNRERGDCGRRWWQQTWCGHNCDGYGNCSYRFITALLGGITVFPLPHFQRDVELPQPGENSWVDRVYWLVYWKDVK